MIRVIKAAEEINELSYPLATELKKICESYGYELWSCERTPSGRLYLSIIKPREGRFPEISYDNLKRSATGFRIDTVSYGMLPVDEFEEVINNYQLALDLVHDLEEAIDRIGVSPETVIEYQDF